MQMISVGDLVTPKLKYNVETLLLWSDSDSPSEVVAEIKKNEILTVIRIEEFKNRKLENIQDEWKNCVCLLLCSSGTTGWTGMGWIKAFTTDREVPRRDHSAPTVRQSHQVRST